MTKSMLETVVSTYVDGYPNFDEGCRRMDAAAVELRNLLAERDRLATQLAARDTVCQSAGACYLKLHSNHQRPVNDVVDTLVSLLAESGLEVNASQARIIEDSFTFDRATTTGLLE